MKALQPEAIASACATPLQPAVLYVERVTLAQRARRKEGLAVLEGVRDGAAVAVRLAAEVDEAEAAEDTEAEARGATDTLMLAELDWVRRLKVREEVREREDVRVKEWDLLLDLAADTAGAAKHSSRAKTRKAGREARRGIAALERRRNSHRERGEETQGLRGLGTHLLRKRRGNEVVRGLTRKQNRPLLAISPAVGAVTSDFANSSLFCGGPL